MAYRHRIRAARTEAPIAPPVDDPRICRWCRGRRLNPAAPCFNGCASNDTEEKYLTLGQCQDCGSEFRTGRQLMDALLCFSCDARDKARQDAYTRASGSAPTGYLKDTIAAGADRRSRGGQ